jgi:hypothetical protein
MKWILLTTLIFSIPELPGYTSKLCIMTFSGGPNVISIEVHVGTEKGIYTNTYIVPKNRMAMTCEDIGIKQQIVKTTYYRRTIEYYEDNSSYTYDNWPPLTIPPVNTVPTSPTNLSIANILKHIFNFEI